jgi:cold shock CspA family protein
MRLIGTVKAWDAQAGVGLIAGWDGRRFEVERRDLLAAGDLRAGQVVEFRPWAATRFLRAERVAVVEVPAPVELPPSGES